jgi:outer membrane lipoprotein-sorting protein
LIDRLSNSDNTLLPRQILFQYTRDYRSRLEGEEEIFGRRCYRLLFTAETGDAFFTQIRAWVDRSQWIPRKIEQVDLSENQTTYLLQNIQIGIALENDFFRFVVPDGVEVIDMR